MPKAELHLHLEGAIRPATLLALAQRNRVELPAHDVAGVAQLFKFRNLHDFLAMFMALVRVLRSGEDFELLGYELGEDLAAQQVRYAEVMLSPSQYYLRGLDLNEIVQGLAAGFLRAHRTFGLRFGIIFDVGRQFGVEAAWPILEAALRNRAHLVVGWSIGGNEADHPPQAFGEVFAAARRGGLRVVAHAGEAAGSQSVWGAIETLAAERIGHGLSSAGDPLLLEVLRERRIVLDMCLTSNVRTGAVPTLAAHPLRRLFDAGLAVTVNSDDPTFFDTTLTREYTIATQQFGFTAEELCVLVRTAAGAALLPEPECRVLVQRIDAELAVLRAEFGV